MNRAFALILFTFAASPSPMAADEPAGAQRVPSFERDIRPILKANCFQCHGEGEKLSGKLDVRLRRLVAQGGESGAAVIPGDAEMSLLFQRVSQGEMPPGKKKLTKEEVAIIGRWIASGAATNRAEPEKLDETNSFSEEDREFWAFQPIVRPMVPTAVPTPPEPPLGRGGSPTGFPEKGGMTAWQRVRNPIDAFLLAKLGASGLTFSPEADKATLIRRAYYDLVGMPPSPEEVDLFIADEATDAYERLIDRLLSSPQYGERWGRHWLDVAGYADSEGYTNDDTVRKEAFKYRDYVIRSFNADKPFDVFIQEQLAGDEMIDPALISGGYKNLPPDAIEKLTATGFLRMAPDGTGSGGVDQKLARNQVVTDTIKIVATSLLGLTVGCAECHNHRYDPIPQADFYRLRAVFEPALDWKNWRAPSARLVSLYTDADRARSAEIEREAAQVEAERLKKQQEYIEATLAKELAKLPAELHDPIRAARDTSADKRTPEQKQLLKDHPSVNVSAGSLYLYDQKAADDLKKFADRAAEIRGKKPVEEFVRATTEVPGKVPATFLFHRGDPDQPKQTVAPGDLSIITGICVGSVPEEDSSLPTTGRRLALAKKLTNGTHPLTARVIVNRVWMHHFGRGIVATPGDFGFLGDRPTHPELLDWLASDFMNPTNTPPYEGGKGAWRLKRLHKLIMTSTAYRQTSKAVGSRQLAVGEEENNRSASSPLPTAYSLLTSSLDPDNRFLWRMPMRRIEAEALRDSVLAVSGKLQVKMFGPPVPIREDEVGQVVVGVDTTDSAGRPTGKEVSIGNEEFRRSLYVQVRRSKPLAVLETFDAPAMEPNCDARTASTVAPQSLLLMNNEFVLENAKFFAERVRREAGDDPRAQVIRAWRLAFVREPTELETKSAFALLAAQLDLIKAQQQKASNTKDSKDKKDSASDPQVNALISFCQALLSANEFLYVD